MKKTLALLFALCFCVGLCACSVGRTDDGMNGNAEKTETEKVREAVFIRERAMEATDQKFGTTIGGNEIKSVSVTITNMEKVSDTEYAINGTITKTDVYGTHWKNNFDCTVKSNDDGESWSAGKLNYTSNSWTRG